MMTKRFMLLLLCMTAAAPVKAGKLTNALKAGKVCEMSSGYIQATPGNETEMATLVTHVNEKRAKVYSDIAAKDGLDPAAVGMENARQEEAANPQNFCPQ